ncbi:MAG: hypothetical protein M4579_004665 [Chaenotheca gracillima]|nr:MAG: hypothetical protein M4579_004665 [Chaenotheca gracillima]
MPIMRPASRILQATRATRTPFTRFPRNRRFQTTEASSPVNASESKLQTFWKSPVGPKTVHFWAPVMKWALVLAGVSDFARPAESLSLTQNLALTLTGAIWTRWCFIIKPRNVLLAAVNFFLGCVGATQVTRILLYQRGLKDSTVPAEAEKAAGEVAEDAKGIAKNPEAAAKNAVKT